MKILYVEDNDQNYRLVMRMLMRENKAYNIMRAENGTQGLELIKAEKPDIVLMDINLPDIDGMEVTRRVREDSAFDAMPIIALTANAMVGDAERIMGAGCDEYLNKPVDRKQLSATIKNYLEHGRRVETDEATADSTEDEQPTEAATQQDEAKQPSAENEQPAEAEEKKDKAEPASVTAAEDDAA
jgi:two-component system cell cycle response regulator DivK